MISLLGATLYSPAPPLFLNNRTFSILLLTIARLRGKSRLIAGPIRHSLCTPARIASGASSDPGERVWSDRHHEIVTLLLPVSSSRLTIPRPPVTFYGKTIRRKDDTMKSIRLIIVTLLLTVCSGCCFVPVEEGGHRHSGGGGDHGEHRGGDRGEHGDHH